MERASSHTNGNTHSHPTGRALFLAFGLTGCFAAVEAAAGWWSGSLALLSDAGHMVTDSVALLIAALAVQAVARLLHPVEVRGDAVTAVALVGLLLNLAVAWMLAHGKRDLNVRAALLHVMGDLMGSVAALVSGVLIVLTGWTRADPALSLLIAGLIAFSSLRLARQALHGLMEGVPLHLSLPEVERAMAGVEGVAAVHDLHIWSLSAEWIALSAHVVVRHMGQWGAVLARLQALLGECFGIEHVTLQPEPQEQVLWSHLPGGEDPLKTQDAEAQGDFP
jgi:cobalt-zinc-cadmium efflux system protein